MTKQEEMTQLRKFPHHYLWNKNRSKWTEEDLVNLATATEGYRKGNGYNSNKGQPVLQHKEGETITYPSIVQASRKTGIPIGQIYNAVNGHIAFGGGFKWEKTVINNNN
jgi:hypothetical protein